uniref:Uncharacterized protein n=1 Tax=Glossina pallidipes TaxID=7398 RepID=A0A1A9ZIS9_GLOPL
MFNKHCAEDYNKNSNKQNLTEILAFEICGSNSSSGGSSSRGKARVIFKAISIFIHLRIKWASSNMHTGITTMLHVILYDCYSMVVIIVHPGYVLHVPHLSLLFLSWFDSELIGLVRPSFVLSISPPFVVDLLKNSWIAIEIRYLDDGRTVMISLNPNKHRLTLMLTSLLLYLCISKKNKNTHHDNYRCYAFKVLKV